MNYNYNIGEIMKIVKTASGKQIVKLSKKEWTNIGEKAGWIKTAELIDGRQNFENFLKENNLKLQMESGNTAIYRSLNDGQKFQVYFTLEYREKTNSKQEMKGAIVDCDKNGKVIDDEMSRSTMRYVTSHKDYFEYPPIMTYEIDEI